MPESCQKLRYTQPHQAPRHSPTAGPSPARSRGDVRCCMVLGTLGASMVRRGPPVRFRRGLHPETAGQAGFCTQPAAYPRAANRHLPENCQSDLYAVRRCAPPAHATPRRPSPARPTGHAGRCRAPSAPAWAPRRATDGAGQVRTGPLEVRSVVITSDSASSPASTRSAAASKQAAESRRPGTASRGGAGSADAGGQGGATVEDLRLRHGPAEHDPGGLEYGQPAVSQRGR